MAFEEKAQRWTFVDLDYDPDLGVGFRDDWALLMIAGWGEDLDVSDLSGSSSDRRRRMRYY